MSRCTERRSRRPIPGSAWIGAVLAAVSWWVPGPAGAPAAGPSTSEALAALELEAGDLVVDLVAAEPEVIDPVAMAFDGMGRLYVVEGRGYPTDEEGIGVIALLESGGEGGRFERRSEFATGLRFANGILPWRNGVFVTDAPDLLFLEDTDGDGVADRREVVLTGFGTGRSTQLRANDPTLGVDGWIHVTGGWGLGEVVSRRHPESAPVDVGSRDLRFDPATGRLEAVDGASQFGICFDPAGHRFVCMNRIQASHVVAPARWWSRHPALGFAEILEHLPAADSLVHERVGGEPPATRLYPISDNITTADAHASSFSAACSVTVFASGGLPDRFRGQLFSCDPTGNLVHRDAIEARGATFVARRPAEETEFLRSRDNWFRPTFLCEGPDGALYVADMCREVIEHPDYLPEAVRARTRFDGGRSMGRIWRVRRREGGGGPAADPARAARRAAAADPIALLGSPDRWVREFGQRRLLESGARGRAGELRELLLHGGREEAGVLAIGLLAKAGALDKETIGRAIEAPAASVREAALLAAEAAGVSDPAWFRRVDPDGRVAFVAVATGAPWLGEAERARLLVDTLMTHGGRGRWLRSAVLSVSDGIEEAVLAALAPAAFDGKAAMMADFGRLLAAVGDGTLTEDCLARLAGSGGRERLAFADGARLSGPQLERFGLVADALEIVADDGAPDSDRAVAARLVGRAGGHDELLVKLLDGRAGPETGRSAAEALCAPPGGAGRLLSPARWAELDPGLRSLVLGQAVGDAAVHPALSAALEAGVVSPALFDTRRREQLASADPRFGRLFEAAIDPDRLSVFEGLRESAVRRGDVVVGRRIFEERCASCHRLERIGFGVGPDLFGLRNQSKETILLHVVMPNREVAPRYLHHLVKRRDGSVVAGLLVGETEGSIVLRGPLRTDVAVLRRDIEAIEPSERSMMPDGLEAGLTIDEVAGLLAFLKGDG